MRVALHQVVLFSSPVPKRKPEPHYSMPNSSKPDASSAPPRLLSPIHSKLVQLAQVAPDLIPVVDELLDRLLVLAASSA